MSNNPCSHDIWQTVITIVIIIIPMTMFILLSSWPQGHCESSLGSFDECSAAHKRLIDPQTKPPDLGCESACRLLSSTTFIIITQPESWYSFTVPHWLEGWVDLGTAGKVHTARAQGCKSQWLYDKHNCPQRDLIPGPRALQSDMLPLDHCDLQHATEQR